MSHLTLLARSSRTLSLLLCPEGARYSLPRPVKWRLQSAEGAFVSEGKTATVSLFLEGLKPDTGYLLVTDIGSLPIQTLPCAGLVEAAEHGVSEASPDNAKALQAAIAKVPKGGTLRLGPGRFTSGPIFLQPDMTLYLDGAELCAPGERTDWPILPAWQDDRPLGTWEGLPEPAFAALVTAVDAHNVQITGRGVIDGGGDRGDWWSWPKETRQGARRPRTVHLAYCHGATLSGVTVRNAPSWTVHPYRCQDLTVAGLTIQNPPDSPNTDGLNPESCEGTRILATKFSVGDDCIAIKAGKRAPGQDNHLAPTRDIEIAHCLMERGHGAIVIGSEMSGGVRDVRIAHCEFDCTDRGLRLKTRRGRGGEIAGVQMEDVVMTEVPTPLAANAFYFCDPDGKDDWVQSRAPAPVDASTPRIRDITIRDVSATGVTLAAAALLGLPEAPITGVSIQNFRVTYAPQTRAAPPLMALGVPAVRHGGILTEFAEVTGTLTHDQPQKVPTPC